MGISSYHNNRPTDSPIWKECCTCSAANRSPTNPENITIRLDDHIQSVQGKEDYEDEMFSIRYFKKGSAHITFRKPELVDRLNDIIAKHYPGNYQPSESDGEKAYLTHYLTQFKGKRKGLAGLLANPLLYMVALLGLNQRPSDYESPALTTELRGHGSGL